MSSKEFHHTQIDRFLQGLDSEIVFVRENQSLTEHHNVDWILRRMGGDCWGVCHALDWYLRVFFKDVVEDPFCLDRPAGAAPTGLAGTSCLTDFGRWHRRSIHHPYHVGNGVGVDHATGVGGATVCRHGSRPIDDHTFRWNCKSEGQNEWDKWYKKLENGKICAGKTNGLKNKAKIAQHKIKPDAVAVCQTSLYNTIYESVTRSFSGICACQAVKRYHSPSSIENGKSPILEESSWELGCKFLSLSPVSQWTVYSVYLQQCTISGFRVLWSKFIK